MNKDVRIPFDLFNLLAELKTVCVLHDGIIEYILQNAVQEKVGLKANLIPMKLPPANVYGTRKWPSPCFDRCDSFYLQSWMLNIM